MININLLSLLEDQETLNISFKDIHPKQVISNIKLKVTVYKVEYRYTTNRGNKRNGEKYFIFQELNPELNMKDELNKWVDNYNKENKHRQLLNVKILNSKCLGFAILE